MAQAACGDSSQSQGSWSPAERGLDLGAAAGGGASAVLGEEARRVCGKWRPGKPTSRGVTVLGAVGDG